VSDSVPSKKFYTEQMFILVRMQMRNHADYRRTTSEAFQAVKSLYDIYTILNVGCCNCARMRFHCANDLLALRT